MLNRAGISFDYAPFEDDALHEVVYKVGRTAEKVRLMAQAYARRFATMRSVRDYDAVLVYREAALIGPELFERWVARLGVPIIYQLDDPLYVPYRSPSNGYLSYLKFFGKVGRIARLARLTIVNSRQHWDYVSRYTDRIRLIPILVDADRYEYTGPPPPRRRVCVGWSGSPTTAANLALIHPTLERLSADERVEIRLIGGGRYDLPGVRFTPVPWTPESEIDELRRLDVGLLPVPTNEWTKRKFFMKLIQYMALGIPPVATPLGANPEVVNHGVNGFLAGSLAEWDAALDELIADEQRRTEMGRSATKTAHAHYTIQACSEAIVEAFRSAAI